MQIPLVGMAATQEEAMQQLLQGMAALQAQVAQQQATISELTSQAAASRPVDGAGFEGGFGGPSGSGGQGLAGPFGGSQRERIDLRQLGKPGVFQGR